MTEAGPAVLSLPLVACVRKISRAEALLLWPNGRDQGPDVNVQIMAPRPNALALACLDALGRPQLVPMVDGVALVPPGYTVLGTAEITVEVGLASRPLAERPVSG